MRTTVYLADMNDFAAINEVYGTYFSSPAPARATVQAARLPKDARVEIDLIASIVALDCQLSDFSTALGSSES